MSYSLSKEVEKLEFDFHFLKKEFKELSYIIADQKKEIIQLRQEIKFCPKCQTIHNLKE